MRTLIMQKFFENPSKKKINQKYIQINKQTNNYEAYTWVHSVFTS